LAQFLDQTAGSRRNKKLTRSITVVRQWSRVISNCATSLRFIGQQLQLWAYLEKHGGPPTQLASQGGFDNINKQEKFYPLPKRYNKIQHRILSFKVASEQNFCCLLMLLSATYTGHIQQSACDDLNNQTKNTL
jgi:hypothetical protein